MRLALVSTVFLAVSASFAGAFEISFTWDGLKLCHDGNARTVDSPVFTLKDVPEGTAFIRFKMVDRDVPDFNRYEWTVTAQTKKNGGKLAVAKASRSYPE